MYFGKHLTTFFAVCLLILISFCNSLAQDTTPPVFTVLPKSDSIFCNNANPLLALQQWYNGFAGAVASDNSGTATIIADKTLSQVQNEFNVLFNLRCGKNRRLFVKFIAKDPSGNMTDTSTVYFKINDESIIVVKQPDFTASKTCVIGIQDSLITWIKNYGNARVTNGCGGAGGITWESFIYQTSSGDVSSGSFLNGPFPEIPANACDWRLDISFFVKDSCDNKRTLSGRYRIMDNVPPVIDDTIQDLTVSCFNIPDTIVNFKDYCDPSPIIKFSENIIRVGDSLSCLFYNYVINRSWIATDQCGNSTTASQKITVLDQTAPIIDAPDELSISCLQKDSIQVSLRGITDQCAKFTWSFRDSISGDSCKKVITRVYSAVDICGNTSMKTQKLFILDTLKPALNKAAADLIIHHKDSIQTNQAFSNWLQNLGGMQMTDQCSQIDTAIVFSNSYQPTQINTLKGKMPGIKDFTFCSSAVDTLVNQSIDFIVIDACGNYNLSTAKLIILDTVAPTLVNCPLSYGTVVSSEMCGDLLILAPSVNDNNLFTNNLKTQLIIDDSLSVIDYTQQNLQLNLKGGAHTLTFTATDCAGNTAVCRSSIFVLDALQPSYRLNLCTQDTLFLRSNLPENIQTDKIKITWFKGLDSVGVGRNLTLPGQGGVFTLKVSDSSCTISKDLLVSIESQIAPTLAVDSSLVCLGDSIQFIAEDFGSNAIYYWFANTGSAWAMVDSTQVPFKHFQINTDSISVYLQVKSDLCVSIPSDTLTIKSTIINTPIIDANTDSILCEGVDLTLSVLPSDDVSVYFWEGPNGFTKSGNQVLVNDSITIANGGTYAVYAVKNGCISDTTRLQITILPKPVIADLKSSASICGGNEGSIRLFSTEVFDSIRWFKNDQFFRTTTVDSLVLSSAQGDIQGVYSAILYRGICNSDTSTINITASSKPVINGISSSAPKCEGADGYVKITTEAVFDSIKWLKNGQFFRTTSIDSLILTGNSGNLQGQYSAILFRNSCSSDTASIALTVLPIPVITDIVGSSSTCDGTNGLIKVISTSNFDSVRWLKNNQFLTTSLSDSLQLSNAGGNIAGFYSAILYNAACVSDTSKIFEFKSSGNLQVSINKRGGSCEGDSMRLEANVIDGGIYQWTGPGGLTGNERIFTVMSRSGLYSLTVNNGSGCSSKIDTLINIPLRPVILNLSSDYSPCLDSVKSFQLSANVLPDSEELKYLWIGPANFRSTLKNPVVNLTDGKEFGRYFLQVTLGNCIGFIDTLDIKKEQGQAKPEISGPVKSCLGDTINLKVGSGYGSYIWETPNGILTLQDTILKIQGVREQDAGRYVVRGNSGACTSEKSDTFVLSLVTRPEIPQIMGLDSICFGDSLRLRVNNPVDGFDYAWILPTGETKVSNPLNIIDLPEKLRGNYSVMAMNGSCASPPSAAFDVKIKAAIAAPSFNIDRLSLCNEGNNAINFCLASLPQDASLDFVITTVPANQKLYQGRDSCFQFNTANIETPISRIKVQSKKDICLSDAFDDIIINFAKKPDLKAEIVASSSSLCNNKDTIFLTNISNPDSVQYFWRVFDNGIVLQNLPGNVLQLTNFSQTSNRVILSLNYDICNNFSRDTLDIIQAMKPQASDDTIKIDANQIANFPFMLDIPTNTVLTFFENNDGVITETSEGFMANISNINLQAVSFDYELCVESCESFCDTGSIVFVIDDIPKIDCKIPNVITPNNDGVNDVLIIDCVTTFPENKLQIFNQWGDIVYAQESYQNDWAGEFKGNPLPAGTYFYTFADGEGQVLSGYLIVQR
ncbi:MAG: gliding motility-associated C-terminal domain-containing protein [Saprospiraceae bacterium]|nr:gliding motility-associated C-terminal domain-containing protein [Saprospiraceae bacterium]